MMTDFYGGHGEGQLLQNLVDGCAGSFRFRATQNHACGA
jgi:hypothetical protein